MSRQFVKYALGASLLAVPVDANAQMFENFDWTPDSTRLISDPTYLPLQGQLTGESSYSYATTGGRAYNSADAEIASFRNFSNTLTQQLEYGVTDDLSVRAAIAYDANNIYKDHTVASGAQGAVDSAGFTNPTFGATYRVIDQSPLSLDLIGSYTPDFYDSRGVELGEDGILTRGGQQGSVGAALGYKLRSFTIQGGFTANFYGGSNGQVLATYDPVHSSAFTDYTLDVMTQTRLNDLLSVNAGYVHTFSQPINQYYIASGTGFATRTGGLDGLRLALNYQFVPNTIVGSVSYDYNHYNSGNTTDPTSPALGLNWRNRDEHVLGVHVGYQLP